MSETQSNVVTPPPSIWGRARDGISNVIANLGFGQANQLSASRYQFDFLSRNRLQIEAMYRSSWICRVAVDSVAEDMTRAGVDFKTDLAPDKLQEFNEALDTELVIWDAICDGIKWARLYGGSIIVMLIDGQDFATPLNVDAIGPGQFKGLLALDRWMVQPSLADLVTDLGPFMGKPKYYDTVVDAPGIPRIKIHYSRVIRLEGPTLPYYQKMTENGWGQSIFEILHDRLIAFDSTTLGAAQLVFKAHLRTVKFKGFRAAVAAGGAQLTGILKTVEFMRLAQTNEGMTVLDMEDEFDTQQYSFSGLSDLLIQFGQQISGALQIPLVRLFGQSPSGMNSTGEGDLKTYYDNISRLQKVMLYSRLNTLWKVAAKSVLGADLPVGTTWGFTSLNEMNAKEKSEVATNLTNTVVNAVDKGIVTRETGLKELKQSAEVTGLWSNISDEEIDDAQNDPPISELASMPLDAMNDPALGDPNATPKPQPSPGGGPP